MVQNVYHITSQGQNQRISFEDPRTGDGFIWADFDPQDSTTRKTIISELPLAQSVKDLVNENSYRPRLELLEDSIFLSLRGVNLTESDCPEDMINIRILLSPEEILTFHTRHIKSVAELQSALDGGKKFTSTTGLLNDLVKRLYDKISQELEAHEEAISELEELSLNGEIIQHQDRLSELRRSLIAFHKFLIPQASVLHQLCTLQTKWVTKRNRAHLKNQAERASSLLGELDQLRQRGTVLQEEIKSALSERMNQSMYRLTIVATIMLPLGLFAGLMGANVGGMPLAESPYGFIVICLLSLALGGAMFAVLKFLKWI